MPLPAPLTVVVRPVAHAHRALVELFKAAADRAAAPLRRGYRTGRGDAPHGPRFGRPDTVQTARNGDHVCRGCGQKHRDDQRPHGAVGPASLEDAPMIQCPRCSGVQGGAWFHGIDCYSTHHHPDWTPARDTRTTATA